MQCDKKGCANQAHYSPVISFCAKGNPNARAEFKLPLMLCKEHATDDVTQFVNDDGWREIVATVKRAGKAYPDRDSLQVRYVPIC